MKRVRVLITGRVQGVGFRYWTEATATSLGLDGWVRNRRDGAVQACRGGPRFSAVGEVELFEDAEPVVSGFRILPTA